MKKYFNLIGRIGRLDFFYIILIPLIVNISLTLWDPDFISVAVSILFLVILICCIWLFVCAVVKRFHDLNMSGWNYFRLLIPLYNIYLFGLLLFKEGVDGENTYGDDPLAHKKCAQKNDPETVRKIIQSPNTRIANKEEKKELNLSKNLYIVAILIGIVIPIVVTLRSNMPNLDKTNTEAADGVNSPPIPVDLSCTKFDYTRWSHCSTDGTQSRVIIEAYPIGCTLTESAPVVQQQQCKDTPLNLSVQDIVNKIVGQIYAAPDKTITTQYFAGKSNDVYIAINKWKLSSDETTLFFESTSRNRATGVITDHIILADTDKDFRPDTYSDNGDQWHNLANQEVDLVENYNLVWLVGSAYFGAYLLN